MQRCLNLAKLGAGAVAPNPMVGAVLVQDEIIIGEGWHQEYGGPHAEVNAVRQAIRNGHSGMLSQSTLYVSLEPCSHHGKTPPCTDLVIQHKIPRVVIGCRDPFKEVDGRGIEKLKSAGAEVEVGILEKECRELNKRFFTFQTLNRPYVVLKWAQTADGKIAFPPTNRGISDPGSTRSNFEFEDSLKLSSVEPGMTSRLMISNQYSNRMVHKWRSEEAAILVGTNTALLDDPELTNRLWAGRSPVRLVVDMDLRLPSTLKIFNEVSPTLVFNTKIHSEEQGAASPSPFMDGVGVRFYKVEKDGSLVHQIMNALYKLNIQSVMVEGGARLLQSFIDEQLWDEVRTVTSAELGVAGGLNAPVLPKAIRIEEQILSGDRIDIYKPNELG